MKKKREKELTKKKKIWILIIILIILILLFIIGLSCLINNKTEESVNENGILSNSLSSLNNFFSLNWLFRGSSDLGVLSNPVLVSSYAPERVFLKDMFQIKCDFGITNLNCIRAYHGNTSCNWSNWDGTAGVFNCSAEYNGTIDNYCNLYNISGNADCTSDQYNKINKTIVTPYSNEFKNIFSTTVYDIGGVDSVYNDLSRDISKIKSRGFNTVWIVLAWKDFNPQPLASPPVYNDESFDKLTLILQLLRKNNMKVLIGLNYLGSGWEPYGIDACNWTRNLTMYNSFENYAKEFMKRNINYSDMIYYHVFTEGAAPCDMMDGWQPKFGMGPSIAAILRPTLGSLPSRLPSDIRNKVKIGYHDFGLINLNWAGGQSPIQNPNSFDFLSMVDYGLEGSSKNEIINDFYTKSLRFKILYPNTPLIVGELGTSNCYWAGNTEADQARVNDIKLNYSLNYGYGFNLWGWKPGPIDQECSNGVYGGYAITNQDGSFKQSAIDVPYILCGESDCSPIIPALSNSYSPVHVNLGDKFQIKCDFGNFYINCIRAYHGNSSCNWSNWEGTAGVFNCSADFNGIIDNYCNLYYNPRSRYCTIGQENTISNTEVTQSGKCNSDIDCNDNDDCTIDSCVMGDCNNMFSKSISGCECNLDNDCNDNNICTTEACNMTNHQCLRTNNTVSCEDGNLCTINDICSLGKCINNTFKNCSDSINCTSDSCNPINGECINSPIDCPCTNDGGCNSNNFCVSYFCNLTSYKCGISYKDIACDDNNSDTINDWCNRSLCQGEQRCNSNGSCDSIRGETCSNCPSDCGLCNRRGNSGGNNFGSSGCIANCNGKVCGGNGCGGYCGNCTSKQRCNSTGQCILIIPENLFPIILHIENISGETSELIEFSVATNFTNGKNIVYTSSILPSGANLDPSSGKFSWTPNKNQFGNFIINFSVSYENYTSSQLVLIDIIKKETPLNRGNGNEIILNALILQFIIGILILIVIFIILIVGRIRIKN